MRLFEIISHTAQYPLQMVFAKDEKSAQDTAKIFYLTNKISCSGIKSTTEKQYLTEGHKIHVAND